MFRGYLQLNSVEIANSSRIAAHVGMDIPTHDFGLIGTEQDCSLVPVGAGRLLASPSMSMAPIESGSLLYTPPDGSRLYGPGLALVGDCWTPATLCLACRGQIGYDDTWEGLADFLGDHIYRPELAPWYTTRVPESAEFGGIWVLDCKGLDTLPIQREVTELAGDGSAPMPVRNPSRKVTFDALLIACTNAGLTYGLSWLACQLRDTADKDDSTLRYFAAHPQHSDADPVTLLREVHGVVLTQEPQIQDSINAAHDQHSQATMYRVSWELTVTRPHAYHPAIPIDVTWDETVVEPIKWVHAARCTVPQACVDMPVLFADSKCEVERIQVVASPPPVCGGCLPVCAVTTRVFRAPTFDYPFRCHETAVSMTVTNNGTRPLTLQCFWRRCDALIGCDNMERHHVQINGLPSLAQLHLDGVSGRYWAYAGGRKHRPIGIVATPSGAPWRAPIIDRSLCWELVVLSDDTADFDVELQFADRAT